MVNYNSKAKGMRGWTYRHGFSQSQNCGNIFMSEKNTRTQLFDITFIYYIYWVIGIPLSSIETSTLLSHLSHLSMAVAIK